MVKMKLNTRQLNVDVVGAIAVAGLITLGYGLFVWSPMNRCLEAEPARQQEADLAADVSTLQTRCAEHLRKIEKMKTSLSAQSMTMTPIDEVDQLLARLDQLGSQCDVDLAGWQPVGELSGEEYTSKLFRLQGTASFRAFHRWLTLVESGLPLVDVTHFSLREEGKNQETGCLFDCTLRVHMPLQGDEPEQSEKLAWVKP
jgi:hypothetical protein